MSYDGRVHRVSINGLTRELPLFQVAPQVNIAIFNMLGDTEIVEAAADALAARLPAAVEALVVPEVKAVPLGHALAVRTGLPYVVVRKFHKPYMANCMDVEVVSITTGKPQNLYLDGKDLHLIQGKQVALVDDVISTGSTLKGLLILMDKAQATVAAQMAVFTEGDEADWSHVTALGHLPIISD